MLPVSDKCVYVHIIVIMCNCVTVGRIRAVMVNHNNTGIIMSRTQFIFVARWYDSVF